MPSSFDAVSLGDVDDQGQVCSPAEGLRWAREALTALRPTPIESVDGPIVEFSASLVQSHDRWLAEQLQRRD